MDNLSENNQVIGAYEPEDPINAIILDGGAEAFANDNIEFWRLVREASFKQLATQLRVPKPGYLQGSSIHDPASLVGPAGSTRDVSSNVIPPGSVPLSKERQKMLYELYPWAKSREPITKYGLYKFIIKSSGMIEPYIGIFKKFLTWVTGLSYVFPKLARDVIKKQGVIKAPCYFLTARPKKSVIYNPTLFFNVMGSYINEIKDIYRALGMEAKPEFARLFKMNLPDPEKTIPGIDALFKSWAVEKLSKDPEVLMAEEIIMINTIQKIEEYYAQLFQEVMMDSSVFVRHQ